MPRNTASANSASAHKSIFRLRSSNIVDVRQTSRAKLEHAAGLHSIVRSIGLGTSMPDELSVSDWCGTARQLCTQNASAVGGAGHTSLLFGQGRARRLL